MRGVTAKLAVLNYGNCTFQLTRLMRGVTAMRGEDFIKYAKFQLTRLMRGVTRLKNVCFDVQKFQLTRLMRGVTLEMTAFKSSIINFNSHASCEA